MARQEVLVKYCDPCGGERSRAVVTRTFPWFGSTYVIDVCERHDLALRGALDKFINVARDITVRHAVASPLAMPEALYEKPVELPSPKDIWRVSRHARQRMIERQVSEDVAREVAQNPSGSAPSRKEARLEERYGQGLVVVVDPNTKTIVTVAGRQEIKVG